MLQRFSDRFEGAYGRKPTFWTWGCCTDPDAASMLPNFAAGCKQSLVLLSRELFSDPHGLLALYSALAVHSDPDLIDIVVVDKGIA